MKKSELSIAMESLINRMDKMEEKISGYENEIQELEQLVKDNDIFIKCMKRTCKNSGTP